MSHVVSLVRHFLTLAFACVLFGAGTSSGGEIQTEPSWPTGSQVAAEEPSPRFLLVKQERAGTSRYPIIVRDLLHPPPPPSAPAPPPMAHASYST